MAKNSGDDLTPVEAMQEALGSAGWSDVLVLDRETARMVLARLHVLDAVPSWDASRRSAADIADLIDRDEEYVLKELERLEAWDVVDLEEDGRVRLRHRNVVVAPLAGGGARTPNSGGLDKRDRARRRLCDLRAMLEEIVDDGSSVHPGIDAVVDAAHSLEGLDRAETALEK